MMESESLINESLLPDRYCAGRSLIRLRDYGSVTYLNEGHRIGYIRGGTGDPDPAMPVRHLQRSIFL